MSPPEVQLADAHSGLCEACSDALNTIAALSSVDDRQKRGNSVKFTGEGRTSAAKSSGGLAKLTGAGTLFAGGA